MVSFGTMSSGRGQLYTIDGGDNTDDVVGGLLQQVSMDSVQEFEVVTARLNAEYSRAGGGAIRIITKSGDQRVPRVGLRVLPRQVAERGDPGGEGRGHWKRSLPAAPVRGEHRRSDREGQGVLLLHLRANPGGLERFALPATRTVEARYDPAFLEAHGGLGTIEQPFRRNYLTAKYTQQLNPNNRLDVRYAYEDNGREGDLIGTGRTNNATRDNAAIQTNDFWSILGRFQTILGANGLNEVVFQGTDFVNVIQGVTQPAYDQVGAPSQSFPTLIVGHQHVGASEHAPAKVPVPR